MSQARRDRRKQEKISRKPRFIGLQFNLDNISPEELKTLQIKPIINSLGIQALIKTDKRIIETNSVEGYRKESKPGFVLKNSNFVSNSSKMGIVSNIIEHDVIVGIDTNTRNINGEIKHVGVAAQIIENDQGLSFLIIMDFLLHGEFEKPENENWKNLILYIIDHDNFSPASKYGIIVDSDLGNIPAYNKREKAIVDDFILPKNFELIYASADISNDSLINMLITACDKYAGLTLDNIEKNCI